MEWGKVMLKEELLELLKRDVVPALGCTEPVCVALCGAYASEKLDGKISAILVEVNPGIYKNGMSAGIPGIKAVGLDYAVAIGACLKNPAKQLEIFEDIDAKVISKVMTLIDKNIVHVSCNYQEKNLYVKCTIKTQFEKTVCIIRDFHTNIVYLEKNGDILFERSKNQDKNNESDLGDKLKEMTISKIRSVVDQMTLSKLDFLYDGVIMNDDLANYSKDHQIGIGIGDTLRSELDGPFISNDLIGKIVAKVSAAIESRLDGCLLSTMSSSGAGTKGITVIIPVHEAAQMFQVTKEKELKALAFAHLVNRYINLHIGKLSPMCSCVMASSTAFSASLTYMLGGDDKQIGYAIRNMSGTVTGMICDGGKVGCALKVSTGSFAAIICAFNAIKNVGLRTSDGICDETPEKCIANMARISKEGMNTVDQSIINIMLEKNN